MDLGLLVNMARSSAEGRRVMQKIRDVAQQFLGAPVRPLGVLPHDMALVHAAAERRSFVEAAPDSPVTLCLAKAVGELIEGATGQGRHTNYAARLLELRASA